MIRRRPLLRFGLAAVSTGGLLSGLTADEPHLGTDRAGVLRIASGEPSGFYAAFSRLLAAECAEAVPPMICRPVFTEASVANVGLLGTGRAELAIALAHTAAAAMAGNAPFHGRTPLRALGRVYENYLQLAVRADSGIRSLPELAGRTVSLGAPESGGAALGGQLLRAAGLTPGKDVRVVHLLMPEAARALRSGTIDGLLVAGGVPLPLLSGLDTRPGFRLLPLADLLPGLRALGGPDDDWLEEVTVPSDAYQGTAGVATIGVANLLLCRPDLPDAVAAAVTRLLVLRADRLVPEESVGTQFLDAPSLIATGAVPLHPGAVAAYREVHG
ncbi:TRAP transporter solute receptor, TAXI family [Streptomyces chartreusis NRRL 3882]|uniref:TRAP transporter solute receptor, TAXI family n=1 Tax=Streptomyces chartreusis NRRL 3882 TaxID=1079985 RepID=A0A2N9B3A8_STRCX|nr:TAXI family TRAP transporter solute-binding subunit [Streptomyces chartreusis]MYS89706.1 TAXI family TRAP transporter solute-binding subunit [Streptomyces sp. SID5464]SOR77831.1 TRAP transporter solute receptor, TAXI family [Streptomyces chartreusis NRRL 3882]